MVKNRLKISPYYYLITGFVCVTVFVVTIIYLSIVADKYKVVKKQEAIAPTIITGLDAYGGLRGAVFYKENRFIPESKLLEYSCTNVETLTKLNINKKNLSKISDGLEFYLFDLETPYTIFKKELSDTIFVTKDGCGFKFIVLRSYGK